MHTLQVTGASRDQFLCLAPATAAGFSVRTACSCGHCCHLRPTVPPSRATAPSSWASAPPSSARTAAPRGFLAKLDDHLIDLTIRTISVESGGCLRSLLFRPARSPCIFLSEAPTLIAKEQSHPSTSNHDQFDHEWMDAIMISIMIMINLSMHS